MPYALELITCKTVSITVNIFNKSIARSLLDSCNFIASSTLWLEPPSLDSDASLVDPISVHELYAQRPYTRAVEYSRDKQLITILARYVSETSSP